MLLAAACPAEHPPCPPLLPAVQAAEQAPAGPSPNPAPPALPGTFQDPASSGITDLAGGSVGGYEGTVEPSSSSLPRPRPSASTETLASQGSTYQRAVLGSMPAAAAGGEVRWPAAAAPRSITRALGLQWQHGLASAGRLRNSVLCVAMLGPAMSMPCVGGAMADPALQRASLMARTLAA